MHPQAKRGNEIAITMTRKKQKWTIIRNKYKKMSLLRHTYTHTYIYIYIYQLVIFKLLIYNTRFIHVFIQLIQLQNTCIYSVKYFEQLFNLSTEEKHMLTFIFLIILLCMLYFVVRKVIRQKLIIERLKSELIQCKNSSKEKE